jgi:hypothetical protein
LNWQRPLLQHFTSVVEDLCLIFTPGETAHVVVAFIRSIHLGHESINLAKLVLLSQLILIGSLWTRDTTAKMCDL